MNVQAMVLEIWTTTQQRVFALREIQKRDSKLFGEWLPRAQGEDVVAGTHTPRPLNSTIHFREPR